MMVREAIRFIERMTEMRPGIGLVLGSGLGGFADSLNERVEVPYSTIPNFPVSTAVGHAGRLVFGLLRGVPLLVMQGRVHLYEGYTAQQAVFGIRVMARLGVRTLILTNAAGAIQPAYRPGDFVLIRDHINLQGANPLTGPNDESLGPRFPDMTEAYSAALRQLTRETARAECGLDLQEGVYAGLLGPNYETPAEIRYLRTIGADLVGMSTVAECIAANHLGLDVLGISSVVNMAAGMEAKKLNHEEVLEIGRGMQHNLAAILLAVLPKLAQR